MNYQDIQDALATLARLSELLEGKYLESEGEVTRETEELEAQKAAVADLLQNDGVDMLGRWLKTKEDEVKMWKAEKASADRRVRSAQNTVDFVKAKIAEVMRAVGMEKAKGSFYSFSVYESEKSTVDYDAIAGVWGKPVMDALERIGLPGWLEVNFKTTTTALKEAGQDEFVQTVTGDAVRFTKPRGEKE